MTDKKNVIQSDPFDHALRRAQGRLRASFGSEESQWRIKKKKPSWEE
jgi:hypothetical protein